MSRMEAARDTRRSTTGPEGRAGKCASPPRPKIETLLVCYAWELGMLDNTTRLLIAEDQTLMAEGLRRLLKSEFRLVEMAGNRSDLFTAVEAFKPDVVLLSLEMPRLNGIQATRDLGKVSRAKIIMVTARDEPESMAEAFRAGASGYVLKRCTF